MSTFLYIACECGASGTDVDVYDLDHWWTLGYFGSPATCSDACVSVRKARAEWYKVYLPEAVPEWEW